MTDPRSIAVATARRLSRRLAGLDRAVADVAAAISHHGFIQIDPINVCGRMQDLILRNRVADYRQDDLMRHLHGETEPLPPEQRRAFEHHHPKSHILAAFPLDAWPHLLAAMRERTRRDGAWSGRLTPDEQALAPDLLAEITARGPLSSTMVAAPGGSAPAFWGSATLAKSTLQKLFFHGRLLIARREGNRRLYDLPERVLPAATLARAEPSPAETARWLAMAKLRQLRLTPLKREELRHVADEVTTLTLTDGDAPPLHCLREDAAQLDDLGAPVSSPPLLLAPLDPLIYDRRVASALWDFDYIWEVYTPPAKRVRGYYALPVLSGHQIVGHVDPKADRKSGKLTVVSRSVRRGHPIAPAVKELARFLGLR
jgi:uncharacterized protein